MPHLPRTFYVADFRRTVSLSLFSVHATTLLSATRAVTLPTSMDVLYEPAVSSMSGSIPEELGELPLLEKLDLAQNALLMSGKSRDEVRYIAFVARCQALGYDRMRSTSSRSGKIGIGGGRIKAPL